ncbi:integrase-like protein [Williamsia limnetica]|uniref:Integrase-like protein n=1 Tax=Williamsia limnetica TaxID=882452 RepID=A0A318RH22_WILLI|nr:integrase-like protein [Williamsia limnetica]
MKAGLRFQCSPTTAKKWADRYRPGGEAAMVDRSSRPHHSPGRTPTKTERRIINLRFTRRWGPHRIAYHLHLAHSTVGAVLRRFKMPLLRYLDQNTGLPVRRPKPVRYEHEAPGDLIHVDIKSSAESPTAAATANSDAKKASATSNDTAWATHSSTTPSTTTPAWRTQKSSTTRTKRPPQRSGSAPTPTSTSTTSSPNEYSPTTDHVTAQSYSPKHSATTSSTNGPVPTGRKPTAKSNDSGRTLNQEWAYAHTYLSEDARAATHQDWVHDYNHHRPHTGIDGKSPIDHITVHNVPGKNS